jgi:hypothetical protein
LFGGNFVGLLCQPFWLLLIWSFVNPHLSRGLWCRLSASIPPLFLLGKKRKWGSCMKLPIKEVQCTCKMKMCISFKDDMNLQLYPPPHFPVMSCVGFFFTQFTWRVCGLQFCGLYS